MKNSSFYKYVTFGILCLFALYAFAEQRKVLQIFRNGQIIQEYPISSIDYLEINDLPSPEDVKAVVDGSQVIITWNPVEDAYSYNIYRSADSQDENFVRIANCKETSFTDTNPLIGTNYYRVQAVIRNTESGYTTTADVTITVKDVFKTYESAVSWLKDIYSYYPDNTNRYAGNTAMYWNGGSIEGYLPWDWVETHDIIHGSLTPSTGFVQRLWKQYYIGITNCNLYINYIDECSVMPAHERSATKAEARALRALFYLNLVKLYGPVPLMEEISNEGVLSEVNLSARNTVDDCFDFIINELKNVLDEDVLVSSFLSNGSYDENKKGIFTREVVDMILCDAYLFRASYLYNGDEYYQSLTNNDGTKLFPQQRDEQKWRDLKDQASKIINSGKFRLVYRHINGTVVDDLSTACPFQSVYYASMGSTDNEELIYGRPSASRETYSMVPRFDGLPSNYDRGGGALTIPLEFIDLYFTKNGMRIEDDPDYFTYDVTDPPTAVRGSAAIIQTTSYKDPLSGYPYFTPVSSGGSVSYKGATAIMKQFYNREARFYLAVTFQNRPWDFQGGAAVQMQYNGNSGSDGITHDYPVFGTLVRKGYYAKDSRWNLTTEYRLAEVYLDYAEACAELGEITEALEYVNKIRSRAGIGQYGLNAGDTGKDVRNLDKIALPSYDKETVLKAIYRERILELAYENKHYFDVRRWSVADGTWRGGADMTDSWVYPAYHRGGEGGDMTGFNVNNVGQTSENVNVNFYKRFTQQERVFTKRMSLLPIPQEEVNRNKVCVQNRDW